MSGSDHRKVVKRVISEQENYVHTDTVQISLIFM
jgi:hypothetical protein